MAERKSFTITWRIKNFSFCWQRDAEELSSPNIFINGLEGSKWTLFLFPRVSRSKEEGFITCYLLHESDENDSHQLEIDYELSALGCDGLPLESVSFSKCTMQGNEWTSPLILKQKTVFLEKRDAFLPKDTLTIRCRIWKVNQESTNAERYLAITRIEVEKVSMYGLTKELNAWELNAKRYCFDFISSSSDTSPISIDIKVSKEGPPKAEIKQTKSELLKICKCKLHFTNDAGEVIVKGKDEFLFSFDMIPLPWGTPVWIFPLTFTSEYHKSNSYLEIDKLSLQCNIAYSLGIMSEEIKKIDYSVITFKNGCLMKEKRLEYIPSLKDDELSLIKIENDYDIQLRTENETFPAHRAILSARSSFFKNKFDQKNTGDIIYVKDLDNDILCQMLLFLYTDTIENMELRNIIKLYIAAARYGVPSLKDRCSCFLQNNIEASICYDALQMADQYQDSDLKKAALDYILEHGVEVIGSDKCQELERFTELKQEVLYWTRMDK